MSTYAAKKAKRRAFGQHFLRDTSITERIAHTALEEATRHSCQTLLEIGPGKGAITQPLLRELSTQKGTHRIQRFLIVEKDNQFALDWRQNRASLDCLVPTEIENADFLQFPREKWLSPGPVAVVSNLPYSVGTAILDRLAREHATIPIMVLMFQKEVAMRIRAKPSTKERGSLSLWIQNRWDVSTLLTAPPGAFSPPPQVDSEVIVLTRRQTPWIALDDPASEKLWETLLKTCFSHRRKMLRSLIPWRNALEVSGVDGTRRAEALHWEEWEKLFQAVKSFQK